MLGVGGVAAATSGHGSRTDDPASGTSTSVARRAHDVDGHRQRGKGPGSRHLLAATSTTVADDDTSTTVEDPTTSTTIEHETGSTVGSTTPTSIEPGDDNGDHHDARDEDADHEADEHGDGHQRGSGRLRPSQLRSRQLRAPRRRRRRRRLAQRSRLIGSLPAGREHLQPAQPPTGR